MKNTLKWLLSSGCILAVVGCANFNSIHRKTGIYARGQTEFVDAKQRAVLVNPVYTTRNIIDPITGIVKTKVDLDYRICSEPSPDVFSAYATSAAAKASASNTAKKGEGTEQNFNGSFGMSSAEAAATIERTQVINMLRESMFRTCERWMNGALSERQMNIQTARDQRMMVATLAIEQLTGVVKRKPTIISSKSVTAMGSQAAVLANQLALAEQETKDAEEDLKTKATETETAKKGYADKNVMPTKLPEGYSNKSCDILIANEADPSKVDAFAVAIAGTNANLKDCKARKSASESAQSTVRGEEAKVQAEKKKKTDAESAYAALNKNTKPPAKGPCDILIDPQSTTTQKNAVTAPPTEAQCKAQNKIVLDAPSNIKAAEDKLGIAKTSAVEPNKAYNDYNKVATMLPAEGVGKSCDILRAETSTDVEKSIVGSSPTKEECDTLYSKTEKTVDAETEAKETVETKSLEEKTIRKQLETQTSLFLSAQTSGTGGDGNDPSSTERMEVVVGAIERITLAAFSDDSEILFACTKEFEETANPNSDFRKTCREIMLAQFLINADAKTGGQASKYLQNIQGAYSKSPVSFTKDNFDNFWEKINSDSQPDIMNTTKRDQEIKNLEKQKPNLKLQYPNLYTADTKSEMSQAFSVLGPKLQSALAN